MGLGPATHSQRGPWLHNNSRSPAACAQRRPRLILWAAARMQRRRAARCVDDWAGLVGLPLTRLCVEGGRASVSACLSPAVCMLEPTAVWCMSPPPLSTVPTSAPVPHATPTLHLMWPTRPEAAIFFPPNPPLPPSTTAPAPQPFLCLTLFPAPQLVDCAWAKWLQEEEGVVDDITVIAVKLNPV